MNNYLFVFLALILTIIIEFIIYAIFIRKNFGKLFLYSVLINGFTNPLANLISSNLKLPIHLLILELLVITAEIFLIKYLLEVKYWKAILISIIANIVSAILGFLILMIIPFF